MPHFSFGMGSLIIEALHNCYQLKLRFQWRFKWLGFLISSAALKPTKPKPYNLGSSFEPMSRALHITDHECMMRKKGPRPWTALLRLDDGRRHCAVCGLEQITVSILHRIPLLHP